MDVKTGWTEYTAAMAIASVITATVRGERTVLRRVLEEDEADASIRSSYGFVVGDFDRSPVKFPATRGVVDLVAYAVQDMRIPYEFYESFLEKHVEAGVCNTRGR